MERVTFSILFYIKRSKLLKNGDAPVFLRITVNGKISEVSLKRSINPKLWDTSRNKAKGSSPEASNLNNYLSSVQGQIYTYHQQFQEKSKIITSKMLKNAFLGIGEKQWNLIELFQKHNDDMEKLVGKDYSPLTLQRYNAALKHVRIFTKALYKSDDIALLDLNHKFLVDFEMYLKSDANCVHNSAMKHMKALRKIVLIAISNDYIKKDPFNKYTISVKPVSRDRLTMEEIEMINSKPIQIERLSVIRDLFIFQCYTGLAFSDLAALEKDQVQLGIDGGKWIFLNRVKTDSNCQIPLFPIAEEIIDRYSTNPKCRFSNKLLPVPSNQKMNSYLKEIADICGIKKPLHTHLARHTFATTVTLANGVPMETISKLLGHTKLSTTQLYSKVLDSKVSKDMEFLRQKFAS